MHAHVFIKDNAHIYTYRVDRSTMPIAPPFLLTHFHIPRRLLAIHTSRSRTHPHTHNIHLQLRVGIGNGTIIRFICSTVMSESVHTVHDRPLAIQGRLAVLHAALAIGGFGTLRCLLLLDFLVWNGARHDVNEELKVV